MTHCKWLFINGQVVEVVFVPDEADPCKASLRQTWAVEGG